jgi:rare lipoprotein A
MAFYIRRDEPASLSGLGQKVRMKIERPLNQGISSMPDRLALAPRKEARTVQDASFGSVLSAEREKTASSRTTERWVEYTIKENDTIWGLAIKKFHVNVDDILKDNGIEDPRKIQPGQKIRVRMPSYPGPMNVVASWYGKEHHGRAMANGEIFDMNAATIAHKEIPLGTRVELENPSTGERAKAVVADRGPYIAGRDVDLSYGLAKRLSLLEKGVGPLVMHVKG